MAKVTKWQVDRAEKRAQRAALDEAIAKKKAELAKTPLTQKAKREKIKAAIVLDRYERDKIRVRRRNGNGKKKKGLF